MHVSTKLLTIKLLKNVKISNVKFSAIQIKAVAAPISIVPFEDPGRIMSH